MKNLFYFILVSSVLSCSSSNSKNQELELNIETVEIADGKSETIANIEIEGMTCEMGCGNSIKSAIKKLNGVYTADIKFTEEKDKDFAIVKFNPSVLDEKTIASAITNLFNGQYRVNKIVLEKHILEKVSENNSNKPSANFFSVPQVGNYNFPNIFNIFFL